MSTFSVVIISYNNNEFLGRCLRSVRESLLKPLRIIVVDDFSEESAEAICKKESESVKFLRNEKNLGPTASRNRGAKLAVGEYIVFLDNDVLVSPDTFSRLIGFAENNPKVGVAGAKMIPKMWWNMGYDPDNFRESIGYLIGFLLKFFPKSQWLKNFSMKFILNYWDYDRVLPVGWVVESCFIIKKEIFDEINGFDESFFMYYEGPDLCRRVRDKGFEVCFYPEAEAKLLIGHTHSRLKRAVFLVKSKYLFYKKHYFYKKSNPVFFWLGRIISGIIYLIA